MKLEARATILIRPPDGTPSASPAAPMEVAPTAPAKAGEPSVFEQLLARGADEVNAHERHLHGITHGDPTAPALGPEELLALQSDVYRYSATVDLTSKVVAQGTQGIQTVLKGGGQ